MIIRPRRAKPDAFTKLYIPFIGANGSQVFRDMSQSNHTLTANGNVSIVNPASQSEGRFGYAGIFDGTGDFISTPDSADWILPDKWTIGMWANFNAVATTQALLSQQQDGDNRWYVTVSASYTQFTMLQGGAYRLVFYTTEKPSAGVLTHLEFGRYGTECYIYLGGMATSVTIETLIGDSYNFAGALQIGALAGGNAFAGKLSEVKVDIGICRHTSNFTPPTRRF